MCNCIILCNVAEKTSYVTRPIELIRSGVRALVVGVYFKIIKKHLVVNKF